MPQALRALRHRNFRLFIGGQLVSLAGTWLQSVAQSWLVYRLTGSSLLLGLAGFCGSFPTFLLAPIGGTVADRRDRRAVLVGTQSAAMMLAFALGVVTLAGRATVALIFALAALLGVVNAFDLPTRQSFVVDMVGREDLLNAIALNSSVVNGARLVGPAGAGVLVAAVGEGWCFVLNGASYLAVLAALLAMRVPSHVRPTKRRSALADMAEGVRFVATTAPIRALLLLLGTVSLVGMPYSVLLQMASSNTLLQALSPDAFRGRVMSAYSMMFMGMAPFGALLAGFLASRLGAPATVGAGGVLSELTPPAHPPGREPVAAWPAATETRYPTE